MPVDTAGNTRIFTIRDDVALGANCEEDLQRRIKAVSAENNVEISLVSCNFGLNGCNWKISVDFGNGQVESATHAGRWR